MMLIKLHLVAHLDFDLEVVVVVVGEVVVVLVVNFIYSG